MGMIIDGIAASEHLDSSGEILDITGHDISDLIEGKGVLNWEHNNDHSEDIIGHIIFAKKIMSAEDADNERQRSYWHLCKAPFVYIQAELFDDEFHPGAIAAAALIRYYYRRKLKVLAGFSIEGATLDRQDHVLKRSVGRRVALTLRPCNKSAVSDVLSDKHIDQQIKKFANLNRAQSGMTVEVDTVIFDDTAKYGMSPINELRKAVSDLQKTLSAGSYDAPPSSLSQGSALQSEDRMKGLSESSKKKLKDILQRWDGQKPIKEVLKADLPDISEDYIEHFASMVDDIKLKKSYPDSMNEAQVKEAAKLSPNNQADFSQVRLIEGLDLSCLQAFRSSKQKTSSSACKTVIIKSPELSNPDGALNAALYYQIARDFFQMEEFVVPSNYIKLPGSFLLFGVTEWDDSMSHIGSDDFEKGFDAARQNGLLQKMIIMDLVLGNDSGRSWVNFVAKSGKLMVADNEKSFSYKTEGYPQYFDDTPELMGIGSDMIDLRVISWVIGLNKEHLIKVMSDGSLDRARIKQAVKRLLSAQNSARSSGTVCDFFDSVVKQNEDI